MRILILRTSALGDIVHGLPVLTSLRRHLPDARIAWVVEASMAALLEGHPDLDEIFPVRMRVWRHQLRQRAARAEVRKSLGAIRRFHADVALDLMGNHKAGALARLSGAPRRIGLARPFRREPSSAWWINEPVAARGDHAVERALSVLTGLDLPPEAPDFGGDKILKTPSPVGRRIVDECPKSFALISPGAGWGNKQYPTAWWGEVARRIADQAGVPSLVTCGPGEEALSAEVAAHSREAARDVGLVDLPTLAALMRRTRLFLGGDTGPSHLAHALDAPTLFVLGPTDPRRHGPYGEGRRALARTLPCSFCYKRFSEVKACLLELPPRVVAERALELLVSL